MRWHTAITLTSLALVVLLSAVMTASARDPEPDKDQYPELINVDHYSPEESQAKSAPSDSLYLMGGPGELSGQFQDAQGLPDRQGWAGIDLNQTIGSHWHVSTFNAADLDTATGDNHAWWCGDYFEPCDVDDIAEGYGDSWDELLDWHGTVPDPGAEVTVRIQAVISYDIEPGEDFMYLQVEGPEQMESLVMYSYKATAEVVDVTTTITPDYYVGDLGDQVHLRWAIHTDGGWSDEDCRWRTSGAAQIDLIQVSFDQGGGPLQVGTTETCEAGDPLQWTANPPRGPGDFSKVWPLLDDDDPFSSNTTPQFAFIDDGLVVPGTGGSPCVSFCYGPGGYIVTPDYGLSESYAGIDNEVWSPVLAVPAGDWTGAVFAFDQYVHTDLDNGGAYVFGKWHVRSTADPAGLDGWSEWRDRNYVLWGTPRYMRTLHNVSDLLVPEFTHVQLALGVMNMYGGYFPDGTPAPYFDNVSFKVYNNVEPGSLIVRPDGSGDYPTIQAAINAAAVNDTVLLADGIFTGEGNRDLSFRGKALTVRSESGNPEACIINVEGTQENNHRGFSFYEGDGPDFVLSGVTITGGCRYPATGSLSRSGGAIACYSGSSPTITNCIFKDNRSLAVNQSLTSPQQGGAISCDDASPVITDCIFLNNTALKGGAIGAAGNSNPVINNCLFVGNEGVLEAGALYATTGDVHITVSSCTFVGNINLPTTGAIVSDKNGRFDIDHTIIAFGGTGYSAVATDSSDIRFSCSNIYGNLRGDWYSLFLGQLGVDGNINLDPEFCLELNPLDTYSIDEDSPCASAFNPSCGLIGYSPVGCGSWSPVEDTPAVRPAAKLMPCYPNPFNPRTTVAFSLPAAGPVELRVYDIEGRLVSTLIDHALDAGHHEVHWEGRDDRGRSVASGVFFCRLKAGVDEDVIRMVLIR